MEHIEVMTSVQRRRQFIPEEKRAMVEEAEQPGNSVSLVARKYSVNPNQLFQWRRLMREGALSAVGAEEAVVPVSEVKDLKARIRELERLLGKKTMEVDPQKRPWLYLVKKSDYWPHPGRERSLCHEENR